MQENRADGTRATWSLAWCPAAACPSNVRTMATAQSSGGAPLTTYYDSLGRLQYASQPYFAGGVTRSAYRGLTTAVTNPLNQATTRVKNSHRTSSPTPSATPPATARVGTIGDSRIASNGCRYIRRNARRFCVLRATCCARK